MLIIDFSLTSIVCLCRTGLNADLGNRTWNIALNIRLQVSDQALLRLSHVFGSTLVHALTLIDKGEGERSDAW